MAGYTDVQLLTYQVNLSNKAKNLLDTERKVGMDIFTRGGKSYIAMDLIRYLIEEKTCRNVAVVAPKSIVDNLKNNIFNSFKYNNRIVYVHNELLSRHTSLQQHIEDNGINPNTVDVILFDEAHTTFGHNIREQLDFESDYIYSKYIIAMTATSINNLKGIDALPMIVGNNCVIHYAIDEAINDGIVNKVRYIPGVLKYSNACSNKLAEIKEQGIVNTYVMELIEKLENEMNKLNGSIEDLTFNYIKDKLRLPSDKGGRVFVFFNTVDEVHNHREAIINIITRLYTYWGNVGVRVNYIPYVSGNTKYEDEYALSVIGGEPVKNQIDVIATCNKGAAGIHPSNVHFGMIMCGTKSITRYMQMVGRLTNLNEFDEFNTNIFDLRNNVSFLGKVSINVGRQKIRDRRKYKRNKALEFFNTEIFEGDSLSLVELESCEELELTSEMFERIQYLNILTSDNESLIAFINDNLTVIDDEFNGNIEQWFTSLINEDYKYGDGSLTYKYEQMLDKYHNIRTALLYDSFSKKDKEIIKNHFGFLGYRAYINKGDKDKCIEYIKQLYSDFNTELLRKKVSKYFIDNYAIDYLVGNMTAPCCAMIQSEDKIANALLGGAYKLDASQFNVRDPEVIKLSSKLVKNIHKLANNTKMIPSNRYYTWLESRVILGYLDKLPAEANDEKYLDTIIRYVRFFYADIVNEYEWGVREQQSYLDRIVAIMIAYKKHKIHDVGLVIDNTICYIANNFSTINDIYACGLELIGIKNCKQFYEAIVNLTKIYSMVDTALCNNDRSILTELEGYITISRLPKKLSSAIMKSGITRNIDNYSDRDIKITVQGILDDTPKKVKVLRTVLKNNMMNELQLISLAFPSDISAKALNELKLMENDDKYESIQLCIAMGISRVTITILNALLDAKVFNSKYSSIITRAINYYSIYLECERQKDIRFRYKFFET